MRIEFEEGNGETGVSERRSDRRRTAEETALPAGGELPAEETVTRVRPSARGVVVNEAGEIILLKCEDKAPVDPQNPHILRYWVTPGGGTKPGETAEESLARELHEEAGLRDVEIGPCIWVRELELLLPRGPVLSHERYFLCRSRQTEVSYDFMTATEKDIIHDIRWWAPEQIAASDEVFRPGGFVPLVRRLLTEGPPPQPIRIEG